MSETNNTIYQRCESESNKYIDEIIGSSSNKKIVVTGPGTGKTCLFKEICKQGKNNRNLVLTFINELVHDLKAELDNLADIRTLHSFANKKLKGKFFTKLTEIIEKDFKIIKGERLSFKKILSNLKEEKVDELSFYSNRRKYYNKFGPHCSIYALIKYFEKDKNRIPKYSQILIDEFQDFNKLEAKLIDLLSEKSSLLIVGDDDQSLYSFKYADPDEIRLRFTSQDYDVFKLPFCFRCPKVIVDSVNSVISKAERLGFLNNRIKKEFKYFHSKEKDEISDNNPKILIKRPVYDNQLAYQIDKEIESISKSNKNFSVLIICPFRRHIKELKKRLHNRGFKNIQIPTRNKLTITKKDGYKLLLKDDKCNLGWRILSSFILNEENLKEAVKKSFSESIEFEKLVEEKKKKEVVDVLKILKNIRKGKKPNEEMSERVFREFGYNPFEITLKKLKEDIDEIMVPEAGYKNAAIRITTLLGAKGLTSDYVFLVNFDDRFILKKNQITDENICQFIVAITRTKKRLYIYSGENKQPIFISWLNKNFYEEN